MRAGIVIGACFVAGGLGAQNCKQPSPTAQWLLVQKQTLSEEDGAWKNDSLRKTLLKYAGMKNAAVAPQLGWEAPSPVDTTPNPAISALKDIPPGLGWPNRTSVGIAGMRAVFLLAHRDTALATMALRRMTESGMDQAIKPDVAILEDRVRVAAGRDQLYGTQLTRVNGRLVPGAIEDSAHVDVRRARAYLPPLAWSVCNANAR